VEGSYGHFFLGWEGAVVRGPLGYGVGQLGRGGPAPRRHGVGGVHPVVHPRSGACDVRPTIVRSTASGRRRGCLLLPRTQFDGINTTTRQWVWKFTGFPLWYFTFYNLLIISFAVRRDCEPFTYCRGLDGEAGPDVTPGDRGDVPRDGCHH
jgi:hypothetical protein